MKKTVNFDDPHSYHLYFGDTTGTPGSLLTFFEWPRAQRGRIGRGTLESIGLYTPVVDGEHVLEDPDGLRLRLYGGERPGLRDVVAKSATRICMSVFSGPTVRCRSPSEEAALIGAGTAHHIAFRVPDDAAQRPGSTGSASWELRPTPVRNHVFPLGLLPDARRDPRRDRHRRPGLPRRARSRRGTLGRRILALPPWLEPERATLERELDPDRLEGGDDRCIKLRVNRLS